MKATGIVRKVDELGRIVLPKSLRESYELQEGTPVEIFVDGDKIILRKYAPGCMFSGSQDNLIEYRGKLVSLLAAREIAIKAGII